MSRFCQILIVLILLSPSCSYSDSLKGGSKFRKSPSSFRGWTYLAQKLIQDGMPISEVGKIYNSSRIPQFNPIYFSLDPKESLRSYRYFTTPQAIQLAKNFLNRHRYAFDEVDRKVRVDRTIIAGILLVETQFGRVTGRETIIYRLSRLASVADPTNLAENYRVQLEKDPTIKWDDVVKRAKYLENTFYPEIPALMKIANLRRISIFDVKGSSAGAFGLPQFLPTSYLKFGTDGNKDRVVSLFSDEDAIWSTANYLATFGWRNDSSMSEKRDVIWKYNKSEAYVSTILKISELLSQ